MTIKKPGGNASAVTVPQLASGCGGGGGGPQLASALGQQTPVAAPPPDPAAVRQPPAEAAADGAAKPQPEAKAAKAADALPYITTHQSPALATAVDALLAKAGSPRSSRSADTPGGADYEDVDTRSGATSGAATTGGVPSGRTGSGALARAGSGCSADARSDGSSWAPVFSQPGMSPT